jgi:hypothetical protein
MGSNMSETKIECGIKLAAEVERFINKFLQLKANTEQNRMRNVNLDYSDFVRLSDVLNDYK